MIATVNAILFREMLKIVDHLNRLHHHDGVITLVNNQVHFSVESSALPPGARLSRDVWIVIKPFPIPGATYTERIETSYHAGHMILCTDGSNAKMERRTSMFTRELDVQVDFCRVPGAGLQVSSVPPGDWKISLTSMVYGTIDRNVAETNIGLRVLGDGSYVLFRRNLESEDPYDPNVGRFGGLFEGDLQQYYTRQRHSPQPPTLQASSTVRDNLPTSIRNVHMITECPICKIDLESPTDTEAITDQEIIVDPESARRVCVTACGHMFHRRCLARCISTLSTTCPSCRTDL